jgi:predicted ATP-dependent serine protease
MGDLVDRALDEASKRLRVYANGSGGLSAPPERHASSHRAPVFTRVGELLAEPEEAVEYLVEGLLPVGSTGLIVAKPKVGKSTFAANMAIAIARGEPFLSRQTKQGTVLYVALEGPRPQWRRTLAAMGLTADDSIYFFIGRAPQGALEWLAENAREKQPVLVIVDTFQRFARVKDLNDYAQVSNATDPLIELARESGAALVYVHHAGKGERAEAGDTVLGSTALFGSVDTAIFLKRTDQHRIFSTDQRSGENTPETILAMDNETFIISAAGTKREADQRSAQDAIEAFVRNRGECDEATIHEGVEGRKAIKVAALRLLVEERRLSRRGAGKKGDAYLYSAADPEPRDSSSLVPIYSRELEKLELLNGKDAHEDAPNASSHGLV